MPRIRQDNDARYALRASFVDGNGDVLEGPIVISSSPWTTSGSDISYAGGDVEVTNGNLVLGNGYGVSFAATSDGPSMTSEVLDDYEEGTWPVTLSDGTTTSGTLTTGRYTKIGQVVIARFDALNNINPTGFVGGSNVRISLPFTAGSTGRSTGSVIVDGIDRGSRTQVNSKVSDNAAYAVIVTSGSNLTDLAVDWSNINSASYVNDITDFCIVYTV